MIFFVSRYRARSRRASTPAPRRSTRPRAWRRSSSPPHLGCRGLGLAHRRRARLLPCLRPGLAVAVLIAAAVVMTLVPARWRSLGERLYWPSRRIQAGTAGATPGSAACGGPSPAPLRRPGLAVALTTVPLLALTAVACQLKLELANTLISGLPADSPPKQALRLAAEDFPAGRDLADDDPRRGSRDRQATAEAAAVARRAREPGATSSPRSDRASSARTSISARRSPLAVTQSAT